MRLITRGGLDWTHRYGDLGEAFRALPCREAVIDGEIVVLDAGGVSRFALLQDALSRGARQRARLLRLRPACGWTAGTCAAVPLDAAQGAAGAAARRGDRALGDPVQRPRRGAAARPSTSRSSRMGLEGVVSKRASAPYQSGPVEDLDQGQGEAVRRLRHRRLHRVGRRRAGSARWRSASGSTASSSIAARSGPASTRRRCADLLARLRAARGPELAHRRARRRTSAGCGRCCRRGSSIPT